MIIIKLKCQRTRKNRFYQKAITKKVANQMLRPSSLIWSRSYTSNSEQKTNSFGHASWFPWYCCRLGWPCWLCMLLIWKIRWIAVVFFTCFTQWYCSTWSTSSSHLLPSLDLSLKYAPTIHAAFTSYTFYSWSQASKSVISTLRATDASKMGPSYTCVLSFKYWSSTYS